MPAVCGSCAFADYALEGDIPAVFVVTFHGTGVQAVLRRAAERAAHTVVPGFTSYCVQCRRVTWLARSECVAEALVRHEHDYAIGRCVAGVQQAGQRAAG